MDTGNALPATAQDWSDYYNALNLKAVDCEGDPHFEEIRKSNDKHYIRKPVITIPGSDISSSKTFVFCDVAVFSSEAVIDLSAHAGCYLVVCARTLVTKDARPIRVKISSGCSAKLILWISKACQALTFTFSYDSDSTSTFPRNSFTLTGDVIKTCLRYTGKKVDEKVEESDITLESMLDNQLAGPFTDFQLRTAMLVLYSHPQLSTVILDFVQSLVQNKSSPLRSEASLLLHQIGHNALGAPMSFLSTTELASLAKRSLDAARSFRQAYERFMAKEDPTERMDAARSLVRRTETLVSDQDAITEDAEACWDSAELTRREAYSNVLTLRKDVEKKGEAFTDSLTKWSKDKSRRMKVQALLASFGILGSVAAIGVGNAGGVSNIPSLILTVLNVGDRLADLRDTVTYLADLEMALELSQEVYEDAAVLNFEVIKATEEHLKEIVVRTRKPDPESQNAITHWKTSVLDISSNLEQAISAGVPSADKYLAAIRKQVKAEQNYCRASLALCKACRDYVQAKQRLHVLKKELQKHTDTLQQLESTKATFDEKHSAFFDRFLAMRNDIVNHLKRYWDSHMYSTLRVMSLDLDVTKPIPHLQMCYDSIKEDYVRYLDSHTTPPASFTKHGTLADLGLDLQAVTGGLLSEKHQFAFSLSASTPGPFKNLCHVYLSSVEVWLEGIRSDKQQQASVVLQVETNGIYENVDAKGKWLTFSTKPLDDAFFVYSLRGIVVGESEMPLEFGDPFIRPTPFTRWMITLSNPDEFDLSDLCSVRFRWRGSAYNLFRRAAKDQTEDRNTV